MDEKKPKYLSDEDRKLRQKDIQRVQQAMYSREKAWDEFNGLTYTQYYYRNRQRDLGFVNWADSKVGEPVIGTGVVREKDTGVLSELLSLKLKPNFEAFDEDNMPLSNFAEDLEDMVIQSRNIQEWEDERIEVYRELIAQGDVFVQEYCEVKQIPSKYLIDDLYSVYDGDKIHASKLKFLTKYEVKKTLKTKLIPGLGVFLGNIKQSKMEKQPYIAYYDVIPRSEAEAIYGSYDRWNNVPNSVKLQEIPTDITAEVDYDFLWNIYDVAENFVGILIVEDLPANSYQVYLNGVPMLPYGFPLSEMSASGGYSLVQGQYEKNTNFAYSKSQPTKSDFDETILDEVYRAVIYKFRQSYKPTLGTTSRKTVSSRLFTPSVVLRGVKKGQFFKIHEDMQGLTAADFQVFNTVQDVINKKTTDPLFAGESSGGEATATEINERKVRQMKKLGQVIDNLINFERRLAMSRMYSIVKHWTEPEENVDELGQKIKKYKTVPVNRTVEDGRMGVKNIVFINGQYTPVMDLLLKEEELSKKAGKPIRISEIAVNNLRKMKGQIYCLVEPSTDPQDPFSRLLFIKYLMEGMNIFGPQAINLDYAKKRFAKAINEDPSKFFNETPAQNMLMQAAQNGKSPTDGSFKMKANDTMKGEPNIQLDSLA